MSNCRAQQKSRQLELTPQIVGKTIQRVLYPPSDMPMVKTTLGFHHMQIVKPHAAGQQKIWYFSDITIVYPVLVKFIATHRAWKTGIHS